MEHEHTVVERDAVVGGRRYRVRIELSRVKYPDGRTTAWSFLPDHGTCDIDPKPTSDVMNEIVGEIEAKANIT